MGADLQQVLGWKNTQGIDQCAVELPAHAMRVRTFNGKTSVSCPLEFLRI
jgi:hypothetical protein